MAYNPDGLYALKHGGRRAIWMLEQTDAVASITAVGYVADATATLSGKGVAGKGVKPGDIVYYQQVDEIGKQSGQIISDSGIYYFSTVNETTGAGTIVAFGAA